MQTRIVATLLLAVWLTACAGIAPGEEVRSPQVRLANVRIAELGLLEQRYVIELWVRNPNGFAVPIAGLSYRLAINGVPFGSGTSAEPVTLRPNGETRLSVELVSTTEETLRQLWRLAENDSEMLDYALYGEVRVDGRTEPLPFGIEGTLGEEKPHGTLI